MTLKRALLAALAFAPLLAFAPAAQAQDAQCYKSGDYFVMAKERTEDVGTDFIIKTLKPGAKAPKCVFKPSYADMVLDDINGALWYEGLAGKYLVLTRSTGPDGAVVIYDLETHKPIVDTPADGEFDIGTDKVVYWNRTDEATDANCPELAKYRADGLGGVLAAETVLDVKTGKTSTTGRQHCSSTQ